MTLNRLSFLIIGELKRLNKYNVTFMSILVAFIWGIVLFFLDATILDSVLPFVLLIDATIMSMMYIGAVMFFEKKESTISTMIVTPCTNSELVLSKVLANTIHNLFSSILIIIAFILLRDIQLNYLLLFLGIIITTSFFTILGLYLAYYQKDFTGMLISIMIVSLVLFIPSVLYTVRIINGNFWEYILLINPVQTATEVIGGGFNAYAFTWKYYMSFSYEFIGIFVLYFGLVKPRFKAYAIKQSGV